MKLGNIGPLVSYMIHLIGDNFCDSKFNDSTMVFGELWYPLTKPLKKTNGAVFYFPPFFIKARLAVFFFWASRKPPRWTVEPLVGGPQTTPGVAWSAAKVARVGQLPGVCPNRDDVLGPNRISHMCDRVDQLPLHPLKTNMEPENEPLVFRRFLWKTHDF